MADNSTNEEKRDVIMVTLYDGEVSSVFSSNPNVNIEFTIIDREHVSEENHNAIIEERRRISDLNEIEWDEAVVAVDEADNEEEQRTVEAAYLIYSNTVANLLEQIEQEKDWDKMRSMVAVPECPGHYLIVRGFHPVEEERGFSVSLDFLAGNASGHLHNVLCSDTTSEADLTDLYEMILNMTYVCRWRVSENNLQN